MPRQISYVADFETTTDENDCRVWSWALVEVHNIEKIYYGLTIEEFIKKISTLHATIYFHNLAFDGKFLLDYLLRNDFTHTDERALGENEFSTLISDMGKFYSIRVRFKSTHTVEFRDSLKKLPFGVSAVARAFNLPEGKGEIDYDAPRPPGYVPTDDEWDYIRRDVEIVARAIAEVEDSGMCSLTVASDSLKEFKRITGKKLFSSLFPLLNQDIDKEIRRAYRGGFTYAAPKFQQKRLNSGVVYDVNSLYPFIMRTRLMPSGVPRYFPEPNFDTPTLWIFTVTFTAKLKRGKIPCIQIKGTPIFSPTEYISDTNGPVTLTMTCTDWKLYNDHYHIEVIEHLGAWQFLPTTGVFDTYIDQWMNVKNTETGGKKTIAKLHLNSLYGKFASNPNVTGKVPVLQDNIVRYVTGMPETRNPVYTAVGVFVTAWARDYIIRAAQMNYPRFAYCDTDSLHLVGTDDPVGITVDSQELGAFKKEYEFTDGLIIGPKKYLEKKTGGEWENHIAGVPVDAMREFTIDDIHDGMEIHGKLQPRTVPGGVVLAPVVYTLKF